MLYSEKVLDHFSNPRNVGEIENADGVGEVGNAKCGDIMKMYIKVDDGIISDVKFKTFGCGAAVATSSMATELIKGKSIDDALKLQTKPLSRLLTDFRQFAALLRTRRTGYKVRSCRLLHKTGR